MSTLRALTQDRFLHAIMVLTAIVLCLSQPEEIDLWLRLRTGKLIAHGAWQEGAPVAVEATSYRANPQWLLDLSLYGLYRAAGEVALRAVRIAMAVLALHLVVRPLLHARRHPEQQDAQSRGFAVWWLAGLALPALCLGQQFVADHVTLLFALIWFRTLETHGPPSALGWATRVAPLQVVWANTDGRFLLGPIIAVAWCAARWFGSADGSAAVVEKPPQGRRPDWKHAASHLMAVGVLVLCCLANPSGLGSIPIGIKLLAPQFAFPGTADLIAALGPTMASRGQFLPQVVWMGLLTLTVISFGFVCSRAAFARAFFFVPVLVLGFLSVRDAALAAAVAAAIGTTNLDDAVGRLRSTAQSSRGSAVDWREWFAGIGRLIVLLGAAALVLVCCIGGVDPRSLAMAAPRATPSDLKGAGPLLAGLGWSGNAFAPDIEHVGQILWFCGPRASAVLEPRLELWGDPLTEYRPLVEDVLEGRYSDYLREDGTWGGWRRAFDQHEIDLLVLSTKRHAAYRRIRSNPYWGLLYRDNRVVILGRRTVPQFATALSGTVAQLRELEWPRRKTSEESPTDSFWKRLCRRYAATEQLEASLEGARSLLEMQLPLAALRQARQVLREQPHEPRAYELLGRTNLALAWREQMDAGQPSWLRLVIAINCFQRALDLNSDAAESRLQLAEAAELAGWWDLAARHYQWLLEHDHDTLTDAGSLSDRLGKLQQRIVSARDRAGQGPDENSTQGTVADYFEAAGLIAQALEWLDAHAQQLAPQRNLHRAKLLIQMGDTERARSLLQSQTWPVTLADTQHVLLGVVAIVEGRYEDAARSWQLALRTPADDASWRERDELCYWLALANADMADLPAARRWFAAALDHGDRTRFAASIRAYLAAMPDQPH